MRALRIGLIGDYDAGATAHRAIPIALRRAAEQLSQPLSVDWLATDAMPDAQALARFSARRCAVSCRR